MSSHSLVTDTHIMIPRHVIDAHAQRSKYDKDTFVLLRRILTTSVNISIPLSDIVVQPSEHPHLTSAPRLFACPITKYSPYSTDGLILVLTSPGNGWPLRMASTAMFRCSHRLWFHGLLPRNLGSSYSTRCPFSFSALERWCIRHTYVHSLLLLLKLCQSSIRGRRSRWNVPPGVVALI